MAVSVRSDGSLEQGPQAVADRLFGQDCSQLYENLNELPSLNVAWRAIIPTVQLAYKSLELRKRDSQFEILQEGEHRTVVDIGVSCRPSLLADKYVADDVVVLFEHRVEPDAAFFVVDQPFEFQMDKVVFEALQQGLVVVGDQAGKDGVLLRVALVVQLLRVRGRLSRGLGLHDRQLVGPDRDQKFVNAVD